MIFRFLIYQRWMIWVQLCNKIPHQLFQLHKFKVTAIWRRMMTKFLLIFLTLESDKMMETSRISKTFMLRKFSEVQKNIMSRNWNQSSSTRKLDET